MCRIARPRRAPTGRIPQKSPSGACTAGGTPRARGLHFKPFERLTFSQGKGPLSGSRSAAPRSPLATVARILPGTFACEAPILASSVSIVEQTAVVTEVTPWLNAIRESAGRENSVEVGETRLSWIILTRQHAYKVKKPIDLGDSRNRTLARRHQACVDEYWLNQPLAPGVYIGALPFTEEAHGEVRLNGKGEPVEWVVKMRRLNTDRTLSVLISQSLLTSHQVNALAVTLGKFYFGQPPKTDGVDDLIARLHHRIDDSANVLKPILPRPHAETLQRISEAQQRFLTLSRTMLNSRVCDGRIVDGHGDLRPEHVFFERQPLIIDCVEYSAALRKRDALDDLCLLAMECERRRRGDVATAVLDAYTRATGDPGHPELNAFYKSLHAAAMGAATVVEAEQAPVRGRGSNLADAVGYVEQAARYLGSFQ